MQVNDQIIMGIDPGTNVMGYGFIEIQKRQMSLLKMGVLKLKTGDDQLTKIKQIFEFSLTLIDEYHPDIMAIEAPFFGKNVQSMLKLGRAQGVVMAAALHRNIPVFEYSPRKVKQAITGKGNASKEQLAAMLCHLIGLKETPQYYDATDAVSIAICHHLQSSSPISDGNYSGWKSFLQNNQDRIIK